MTASFSFILRQKPGNRAVSSCRKTMISGRKCPELSCRQSFFVSALRTFQKDFDFSNLKYLRQ